MKYNKLKVSQLFDIGIATMCVMAGPSNSTTVFPNKGPGVSSQLVYVSHGSGKTTLDEITFTDFEQDTLTDIGWMRGSPITGYTGENGFIWVGFNPLLEQTLQYEYLVGPQTISRTNSEDSPKVLVALKYDTIVNDKLMEPLNFVRIRKDVTANIVIPEGSIAILLWH